MEEVLIVTRHPALVKFLEELGVKGEVVSHATEETVAGRKVYGVLPMRLAALCETFTEVSMVVPQELRGKELTLEQVKELQPELVTYKVERVSPVIM